MPFGICLRTHLLSATAAPYLPGYHDVFLGSRATSAHHPGSPLSPPFTSASVTPCVTGDNAGDRGFTFLPDYPKQDESYVGQRDVSARTPLLWFTA
ncbi:hypothetical protein DPEC_G00314220 [Dallia pectoralis]|uniref:Uncharacterized protein n=1 Tax=Dallia pectoralis TaxID=75939 RepID=A0ACC2FCA1_DALPE|nr:hypothetical protein DPEC_G00314220 [Dallia pectoralis]